jgi:hypothetical protein
MDAALAEWFHMINLVECTTAHPASVPEVFHALGQLLGCKGGYPRRLLKRTARIPVRLRSLGVIQLPLLIDSD